MRTEEQREKKKRYMKEYNQRVEVKARKKEYYKTYAPKYNNLEAVKQKRKEYYKIYTQIPENKVNNKINQMNFQRRKRDNSEIPNITQSFTKNTENKE